MLTIKKWRAKGHFLRAGILCVSLLAGCTPPGPKALLEGEKLIKAGRGADAVEKLKMAVELLPQNAQAWNHLGLAYHQAGQADNALRAYQQALAPGRNLTVAHFNLGCLYLEQNNFAAAADELRAHTVLQPQSLAPWLRLASAQLRLRQPDAAERSYRTALALKPNLPEALNGLGIVQIQKNRSRDAAQFFTAALAQQPDYPPALLNLAIVSHYYLLPRPVDNRPLALQKYRQYLALEPRPANWEAVARVAQQLELELNPPLKSAGTSATESADNSAKTLSVTNSQTAASPAPATPGKPAATNHEPVMTVVKLPDTVPVKVTADPVTAPASSPAPPRITTNAAAKAAAAPAPKPAPTSGARYAYHAPAAPKPGNRAEAQPHFELGLQLHRPSTLAEARVAYGKALQMDPAFFEAHYNLALAEFESGDLPQSLLSYETALALQPDSADARYNFSVALRRGNFFPDAADELDKLLAAHPGDARAHFALASLCAVQLNQKARARAHYRRVLELQPGHPQATDIRYWLAANRE